MNQIANKFLLPGERFMPEMNLTQPGFTYGARGSCTKNKERIQKFKERGDSQYIYQNELDKTCFQHEMAYGDFKDLARRTASDKILGDKAFEIVLTILIMMDINVELLQWSSMLQLLLVLVIKMRIC